MAYKILVVRLLGKFPNKWVLYDDLQKLIFVSRNIFWDLVKSYNIYKTTATLSWVSLCFKKKRVHIRGDQSKNMIL